nr:hypothetical protein [Tanacetum cinerariifolium]
MALCTNLQTGFLKLEKTKTTQQNEIDSLKRRVKKLEKKIKSRTHKLKRLYKVGLTARVESSRDEESLGKDASKQGRRIDIIDQDEDITLVNVQDDAEMFDVNDLGGEGVFIKGQDKTVTTEELTLAQALEALKTLKPKKKDQIRLDEEAAKMLQAEFDEDERIARERAQKEQESNIALIETWDDIQANTDADHQLAERLQAQEQEELSDAEKATLFQQLLEKRRKHFAAKRTSVPTEVVADEAVYEKMYDSVERAATTATGLDAKTSSGSGPRCHETIGDAAAQTRVLNMETTKNAQAKEILSLEKRVKRLEKKKMSRTHGLKRLYKIGLSARVESSAEELSFDEEDASKQGRNITDIDANAKTTLVDELANKEVDTAQDQVSAATTTTTKDLTVDDITLAKALDALKTSKPKIRGIVVRDHKEPSKQKTTTTPTSVADSTRPKAKGIVMQEPSEAATRTTILIPTHVKDKGKGKMVEPEIPLKKKAQISLDEELAFKLQVEQEE